MLLLNRKEVLEHQSKAQEFGTQLTTTLVVRAPSPTPRPSFY